jgi:glycosyltransferase involved in cell wall biosynthesis
VDITVVTPTYNRATLLSRLYESLLEQTYENFEWLIVDDGSTDATREVIESWKAPFPVSYVYEENAGVKVAWNRGVELARGDHIAVLGSDDRYLPEGLERLVDGWRGLDASFASVNGRTLTPEGRLNGTRFEGTLDIDSFSLLYRRGIIGDTVSLARADVVRRFPFPYAESRGGPEGTAFNRIARHYKTRFLSEPIAIVDYQRDGLSARTRAERLAESQPWLCYYWEAFTFPRWIPLRVRAKCGLNTLRFGARALRELHRRSDDPHRRI